MKHVVEVNKVIALDRGQAMVEVMFYATYVRGVMLPTRRVREATLLWWREYLHGDGDPTSKTDRCIPPCGLNFLALSRAMAGQVAQQHVGKKFAEEL